MCQGDTRGSRTRTTRGYAAHYGWLRAGLLVGVLSIVAGCDSEAKVDRDIVRPVKVAVVGEAVARADALTYSGSGAAEDRERDRLSRARQDRASAWSTSAIASRSIR